MTLDAITPMGPAIKQTALSPRRLAILAGLALVTALPTLLISGLVGERETRADEVQASIAKSWGPAQTVWGPLLVLPIQLKSGAISYLKLAPETLEVKAEILPQQRRRGLFAATVYDATIAMSGHFAIPAFDHTVDGTSEPLPAHGFLAVPVTDIEGVRAADEATIGAAKGPWQLCRDRLRAPSCDGTNILLADVDLSATKTNTLGFTTNLHLRGTQAMTVAAAAKQTIVSIKGTWPDPRFFGDALPTRTTLSPQAFDAEWRLDEIGKPRLTMSQAPFDFEAPHGNAGVDLIEATPVYRMISRALKYSLLIIILAFTTYLLFELLSGLEITLVQYSLLGASLSLFTLLLLSVSEFIGYGLGYTLSATLVLAQASLYTISVTRRVRPGCLFAAMLAGLFGFLYVLLGLESYALLVGTVAVFVLLSIVMAVTQHVHANTLPLAP